MWSRFVVVLGLIAGCGEKVGTPPKGPPSEVGPARQTEGVLDRSDASTPALSTSLAGDRTSSAPGTTRVGHLEHPERLNRLFEAFARLDGGRETEDARIVQYGDSHTASDLGTSVFRRVLQARFGDGGRGFVSLGKPWKTYWQDGVRGGGMTDGFEPVRVRSHGGTFFGLGGSYGLLGVGIGASKKGERAWTAVVAHTTRLELDYWQEPSGGSFDVFLDGARAGHVTTRADKVGSGFSTFEVADAPHQVELRTTGDGDVRVFGMALDRAQAGVVVDALGINGAQIFTPLRWSEEHFAEQLRHRAPDLVVLAYGTNESLERTLSDQEYERTLVDLLGRVARAIPAASCLLLGPPDRAMRANRQEPWASAPRVSEIVEMQRRVAVAVGCAFYDQMEAMGGPGSIAAWAAEPEPRAARDHVHLTRSGYAQLGASFADDLLHAYDDWLTRRALPATTSPKVGVAIR